MVNEDSHGVGEARFPNTVLVVEDDEALLSLIQKTLGRAGFQTRGVLNGAEAIDWLVNSPATLILLDYRLPDMTGRQFVKTLAKRQFSVPFIVATGQGDEKIAVEMMKLGARDYLVKDATFLELLPQVVSMVVEQLATEKRLAEAEAALRERNEQLDAQNEELMRQQQELIEKTREVQRANQLKSEFLANMSHELRTPLNVIVGFSQLMADGVPGKVNEEQRQCLGDILAGSQHLLNLINEVLDLSKIESGKMELKPENIDLTRVVASLTRTMMPVLAPRKQSLDIKVEEGMPPVHTDGGKFEQVMLNLVDNASKFTTDGGKLKIEAGRDGDWCQVSVIDNGTGIKKEDQERIFEPFSQLDNPLVKERRGTGLGLPLIKQIIERYGGQIWVESEYGKGSRFTFTVPLAATS